jgi:ribose-phosphate pyrophosphokinase
MVRNIVVLGGNSHPSFTASVCEFLGVSPSSRVLDKFSSGETRCEIRDSVRGKDVYIIQSFGVGNPAIGARVNDYFIELCIMISACKTGSAKRVTAVLPLFPYSRQPDLPYAKAGAPLSVSHRPAPASTTGSGSESGRPDYTFESVPATPAPSIPRTAGFSNGVDITGMMDKTVFGANGAQTPPLLPVATLNANAVNHSNLGPGHFTTHDYENPTLIMAVQATAGYKQWMAQSGSLVADLLTCAGADRVLTCDLHESTYQGFFDIPGSCVFFLLPACPC